MSGLFELTAEIRSDLGKGASRRLRRIEEKVPGVIYGDGKEAVSLTLNHRSVLKALENEAFYSHILTIDVNGKKELAVLKDVQRHAFKPRILHLDFMRVGKQKIVMHVPLHFLGADVAPGVKTGGGIVSHVMTSVDVRCLPSDLPEYIEVDLSKLELDEAVHLSQLKLPKGVELVALAHAPDHDLPVANIHIPRAVIEAEPVAEVEATEVAEGEEGADTTATAATDKAAPANKAAKKSEDK